MQEWFYQIYGFYPFDLENGKCTKDGYAYELFAINEDMQFLTYYEYLIKIEEQLKINIVSIVMGNTNEFVYQFNDINYVLVKGINEQVKLKDILYIHTQGSNLFENIDPVMIREKWMLRSDHIEIDVLPWISNNIINYEDCIVNIYVAIGYAFNAIKYIKNVTTLLPSTITNKRIISLDSLHIFNPLFITVDHEARDICELYKLGYFDVENFLKIIHFKKYSKDELIYIVARLLFPTYFYDFIEEIYLRKNEVLFTYKYEEEIVKTNLLIKTLILQFDLPVIRWLVT